MRRALVLLVLAGCGATPPPATALDASRANVALADLEQGRSILLAKCSSCHHTPVPAEHPQDKWPAFVADMAPKAKLDADGRRLVELYLVTLAGR